MKDYINNYQSIRNTFIMEDRDKHKFDPENTDVMNNALEYALRRSFRDFNFRTLTAVKSNKENDFVCKFDEWRNNQKLSKKEEKDKEKRRAISESRTDYLMEKLRKANFYQSFIDYFKPNSKHKTADGFKVWHNNTCELFLTTLNEDYENLCYGKAQKIVNMMFKHLYCLDGAEKYDTDGYFKHCHLTLDSFTLEWFRRNVIDGGKIGIWSNLHYDDGESEYDNYTYYLEQINAYFEKEDVKSKYNGLTAFQFEFYMWPEMQLQLAAEAFYFALEEDMTKADRQAFRDMNTQSKITKIIASIDNFLKD